MIKNIGLVIAIMFLYNFGLVSMVESGVSVEQIERISNENLNKCGCECQCCAGDANLEKTYYIEPTEEETLVEETLVEETLVEEVKEETLEPTLAEDSQLNNNLKYVGDFRITGYYTGKKTASGTKPTAGRTIAMNRKQMKALGLSYGQKVYIKGSTIDGEYIIEDCGCGFGVIDVFCKTKSECYSITTSKRNTSLYLIVSD